MSIQASLKIIKEEGSTTKWFSDEFKIKFILRDSLILIEK